ncbi:MAG: GH3 auxin-responsive promoter family protein [Bacteroidetes bacterium]|nr:GH3 auxin-responsive promoter family protein [Bacteroidota bacterium]
MTLLGKALKKTIEIGEKFPKLNRHQSVFKQQAKVLNALVKKAQFTAFGEHYHFSKLLQEKNIIKNFSQTVPAHDYNSMFKNWWYRSLNGEPFVTWPGQTQYFALSSGTSEASSKHIPVTKDMLKAIRRVGVRQMLSMAHLDLPEDHFRKGILMIGGSTHLNYNGTYYEGDLSGITTGNIPFWFQFFYKPGYKISRYTDWQTKLDEITRNAKNWDIGIVCGVPAWIQILFEKIVAHYQVKTIHDIWPNLRIYVSGGVAIAPYVQSLDKLTASPIIYIDTYLASEGFIAYQKSQNIGGPMQLITDNGIYFEFVPFTDENFDSEGNLKANPQTLSINQVEEDKEYALLLSTCSGAWRYLIGDVVKFTSVEAAEILITGRTKHFLSLCGEHLSVDNMNKALSLACAEMNIRINEYCVCGVKHQGLFAHQWYVASDEKINTQQLREKIDAHLKVLNDDYRVERTSALKDIFVHDVPSQVFIDFLLKTKGKLGAQTKFPRVLKGKVLEEWNAFLKEKGV